MPRPDLSSRAGFTLLEVVVALALSGLVLLGARMMLGTVADGSARIAAEAAAAGRDANAERTLRDLLLRVEVDPSASRGVAGDERGVRFSTWCEVPAGWLERCTALLGVIRAGDGQVLALETDGGRVLPIRRGFDRATLRYLERAGGMGAWSTRWTSSTAVPEAVMVVVDADTLVLRIGGRG